MKKLFFLILCFTISGCNGLTVVEPTVTATNTPTTTLTPTITPVPPTASPEPTSAYTYDTDPCWIKIEDITIPKSNFGNFPYAEIAKNLFDKRLKDFTLCQPPSLWRLDDYEILRVEVYTTTPPILVGIDYSIKPSQKRTWFASGNGKVNEENRWIEYKYICFEIVIGETEYHLEGGWTLC